MVAARIGMGLDGTFHASTVLSSTRSGAEIRYWPLWLATTMRIR